MHAQHSTFQRTAGANPVLDVLREFKGSLTNAATPDGKLPSLSMGGYQRNKLYRNNGDSTFTEVGYLEGADRIEDGYMTATADIDGDGRQDLILRNADPAPGRHFATLTVLKNDGAQGKSLALFLRGDKSNRDGIGALVTATVGDRRIVREIRSVGGAAAMLILVLYPYVYLLARAAFLQQSSGAFLAARVLGNSAWRAFWTVSLPMARPAIAGGVLLAVMETIADFGTVAYFGVQTFATGIYTSWFTMADRAAAAQLALCLLAFALVLAVAERSTRGRAQYHHAGKRHMKMPPAQLRGGRAALAFALCATPVLLGFLLPTVILFTMGLGSEQDLLSRRYTGFIRNSVTLAGTAAVVTLAAAIAVGFYQRLRPGRRSTTTAYLARLGYAVPGGVIAVGLLVPFAAFDNAFDAWMRETFDISTGLLITGSIWLLVAAYMVRFLAAALGAYEGGQSTVHMHMDAAARSLGESPLGTLRRIHLPILTPSLLTALLIVFVDVMKELPATLIMRPFNYDTLAIQAYRLASDERLEGAAVPSLVIVAMGLLPVILICRQVGRRD